MHTQNDKLIDQFETDLRNGNSPEIDSWVQRVPEGARQDLLLELIALEIFYRSKAGQRVKVSDYAQYGEKAIGRAEEMINPQRTAGSEPNVNQMMPSRRIGRYKLLQKIGEGGMGAVWMAEQQEPVQRRVAMKLIKSELASKEVIARFEAERQALALMDHQNIAKVLDAGTTNGGTPFFVMELVKGIPITEYCDQNKLCIEDRLRLFTPVCKAIQHAHQKGILHRDLKPSNVLVTHYDGEAVPKVIDFGMAKAITHSMRLTDKTLFTEFGKVVGTLQYMSPEQAEMNALDVDTRADIYSLGVMLYELLTGSTPVDERTLSSNAFFQVLQIIREKDPPPPSSRLGNSSVEAVSKVSLERQISFAKLRQVLKGDLDWVVMKALEKDRTRRYQTAADFARDISNYLEGEPVIARPPSSLYQIQKFAGKNRGLVASALAVGLALLIGMIGTSFGLVRANRKTEEADHLRTVAEFKTREAERAEEKAKANERIALIEKDNALKNETRAVAAEKRTLAESKRARDAEAAAKFQLANARFDANRALEARTLLHEIPTEYRNTFEWNFCNRKFLGSDLTSIGHEGYVYKVAFSPDGRFYASASADKTVRLWDAVTGKVVRTFVGHAGSVGSIAFSPSGRQLASASSDRTVRLWDVKSGQEIGLIAGHEKLVASVAFSPDGEALATASDDKTIRLWDSLTFENLRTFRGHTGEVGNVVFSPDGKRLVSSSVDRTVRIWNIDSGLEASTLTGHDQFVISVAYSPDGKYLASASFDTVKIWDATKGVAIKTLKGHTQYVHHVAFSPEGTRLATAGRDRSIKIWDVQSGLEIFSLSGHAHWVNGVAFSPDGQRLVSASFDRNVKVWDARTGQHINTIRAHADAGTDITFSPGSDVLASVSNDQIVKLWDAKSGEQIATLDGLDCRLTCGTFSADGKVFAAGGTEGLIKLWSVKSGKQFFEFKGHKGPVHGISLSSNGKCLASAGHDQTVKVWDTISGEETLSFEDHEAPVQTVAFSPTDELIASASRNGMIRIWQSQTGQQSKLLSGHRRWVHKVEFSSNGERLASAGGDSAIRLWDVETGEALASLTGHSESVTDVAFNSDGTRLASSSRDKSVKLWDVNTNRELLTLDGHGQAVTGVDFSADDFRLASIDELGEIKIWDSALGSDGLPDDDDIESAYQKSKSEFDPIWHQNEGDRAVTVGNWFGAVHHFAWLMNSDPTQAWSFDRLHVSYDRLVSQQSQSKRGNGLNLQSFVKDSLELPRGEKLRKINWRQANEINSNVWDRVRDPKSFKRSPLTQTDLQQYRDLVQQHPNGSFFNTLATAEFRMENFAEAIAAAKKSIELSPQEDPEIESPYPGDLAIMAMAHFKLNELERARVLRASLEEAMKRDEFKEDTECKSFDKEVDNLFQK